MRLSDMKIKKNIKNFIVCALIFAQLLGAVSLVTACGQKREVPELLESTGTQAFFRPVEKRIVGKSNMFYGIVVPMDYPCFSKEMVSVSSIEVEIGDYIEEGQIVAYGDVTDLNEQINELSNQKTKLQKSKIRAQKTHDARIEELGYERMTEDFVGNPEGAEAKVVQTAEEQEELSYDLALLDQQIASLDKDIAKLVEKRDKQTFLAPHSGYVTFVADLSKGNVLEGNTNIVVISDYDDLYIEMKAQDLKDYQFEKFQSKWTVIGGEPVDIDELDYTNSEVSYATSKGKFPYMRFVPIDGRKLTMGETLPLYFMNSSRDYVLTVGNDSLYYEEEGTYLYVKTGEDAVIEGATPGDVTVDYSKMERRKVEVGASDGLYTEIRSGVEEGEEIFYKTLTMIPNEYKEYEVVTATFGDTYDTKYFDATYPGTDIYIARYSGTITNLAEPGNVSAGDHLFDIKLSSGVSEKEKLRLEISKLDTDHQKTLKDYNAQKEELEGVINDANNMDPSMMATDTDAIRGTRYLAERTQCQLDALNAIHEFDEAIYNSDRSALSKKYNQICGDVDGDGIQHLYASSDGVLDYEVSLDNAILKSGEYIMTVTKRKSSEGKLILYVGVPSGSTKAVGGIPVAPALGQKVRFEKDGKEYEGHTIGKCGQKTRYILFTRNNERFETVEPQGTRTGEQFYVEVDSDVTIEELTGATLLFDNNYMENSVAIPRGAIHLETDKLSGNEKYFVWKVKNGQIVKEFVVPLDSDNIGKEVLVLNGINVGDVILI